MFWFFFFWVYNFLLRTWTRGPFSCNRRTRIIFLPAIAPSTALVSADTFYLHWCRQQLAMLLWQLSFYCFAVLSYILYGQSLFLYLDFFLPTNITVVSPLALPLLITVTTDRHWSTTLCAVPNRILFMLERI